MLHFFLPKDSTAERVHGFQLASQSIEEGQHTEMQQEESKKDQVAGNQEKNKACIQSVFGANGCDQISSRPFWIVIPDQISYGDE